MCISMQPAGRAVAVSLLLILSGCATVPEPVKVALAKEGEAIDAVAQDHRIAVNAYHEQVVALIDARLDDVFYYEVRRIEASDRKLTAADVEKLEAQRKKARAELVAQAEQARNRFLASGNLAVLAQLHGKVLEFAAADRFTASDFGALITQVDADLEKIRKARDKAGGGDAGDDKGGTPQ